MDKTKLRELDSHVHLIKDAVDKDTLDKLLSKAKKSFDLSKVKIDDISTRCVLLDDLFLLLNIKNKLETKFNISLDIQAMEINCWCVGSESTRHIHDENNRDGTKYNAILYLNNDYEGGEFFTDSMQYKPNAGDLLFFNGQTIYHGLNKVKKNHRYNIIFWWKDNNG